MNHRQRLYLDQEGKWSSQEAKGLIKLEAISVTPEAAIAQNILSRRENGQWMEIEDSSQLSGRERGWIWKVGEIITRGQPLHLYQGLSVIDQNIIETLGRGLHWRDYEGRALSDPRNAGPSFTLVLPESALFQKRVKAAGGQIIFSALSSSGWERALRELEKHLELIKEKVTASQTILLDCQKNNNSEVLQLGDNRSFVLSQYQQAQKLYQSLSRPLEDNQPGWKEWRLLMPLMEQTDQVFAQITESLQAHQQLEAAAARDLHQGLHGAQDTAAVETPPLSLLHALAAYLRRSGQQCEVKDGHLLIETDHHLVDIGEQVFVRQPSGEVSLP